MQINPSNFLFTKQESWLTGFFHIENIYSIAIHYPSLVWLKNFFCFITQRAWFLKENVQSRLKHAVKHRSCLYCKITHTDRSKCRFPPLYQAPCPRAFWTFTYQCSMGVKNQKKKTNYPATAFNYFSFAIPFPMEEINSLLKADLREWSEGSCRDPSLWSATNIQSTVITKQGQLQVPLLLEEEWESHTSNFQPVSDQDTRLSSNGKRRQFKITCVTLPGRN